MADAPKDLDGASSRRPALRPFSGRPSSGGQGALRPLGSRRPAAPPFSNTPGSPGPSTRPRLTPPAVAAYIASEPEPATDGKTALLLAETTEVATAARPTFTREGVVSTPASSEEGFEVAEASTADVAHPFGDEPVAAVVEPPSPEDVEVAGAVECCSDDATPLEFRAEERAPRWSSENEIAPVAVGEVEVTAAAPVTPEEATIPEPVEDSGPVFGLGRDESPIGRPAAEVQHVDELAAEAAPIERMETQDAPVALQADDDARILPGGANHPVLAPAEAEVATTVLASEAGEAASIVEPGDIGLAHSAVIGETVIGETMIGETATDTVVRLELPAPAAASILVDTDDLWPHDLAADVESAAIVHDALPGPGSEEVESIAEPGTSASSSEDRSVGEVVATVDRTVELLDEELSEFRLTAGERLHEPTPIPGLEALSPSGEEPLQGADDPRGANAPVPALADADDTLRAFTDRAAAHDHVIDTLEAVARRVRSGEIVPVTSASATPEAVLASVLASLLALRT